jgi:hypothetical protein
VTNQNKKKNVNTKKKINGKNVILSIFVVKKKKLKLKGKENFRNKCV